MAGRRRATLLAAGCALVLAFAAGCGSEGNSSNSGVTWEGSPSLTITPKKARIVTGRVKYGALDNAKIKIRAPDVRLLDQDGMRIKASVAFVSGFVRSLYPQNGRPGMTRDEFPEAEQRRIGHLAVMRPGETLPFVVSWNDPPGPRTAVRIDTGYGVLSVPKSAPAS